MFKESKIKSIEPIGLKLVCDITVEQDHSYIGNGFINHNSSTNPNMQNIPRVTTNPDIKRMFVPPPGYLLLQLDYSQAELRVFAAEAGETTMIEWFKTGRDIHLATACDKNHWDYDERLIYLKDENHPLHIETVKGRKYAKTINFGIIYGQGADKLSEGMGLSKREAQKYIKEYFRRFPKLKKHINKQHRIAHEKGFVKNVFGRKRRLYNSLNSGNTWQVAEAERQSVNCVDGLTQALTKEGWKSYNELKVGELILTKCESTEQLEWKPIKELNIYPDYEGDLYYFENNSFDALTTDNHRWLCNITTKRDTNQYFTSKELKEGKLRLIHRQGNYVVENNYNKVYSDELIKLIGLILTDGSIRYYDLPNKPRNGKPWYVTFTQTKQKGLDAIRELIANFGLEYKLKVLNDGHHQFRFKKSLAEMLDKIIPGKKLSMQFLLNLTKKQISILLEYMKMGDGHRNGNDICSGLEDQADFIQILNIMNDTYSNIIVRDNIGRKCYSDKISNKGGYIEIKNKSYSITSGRRKYFHTKGTRGKDNIKILKNQKELVWCPTVENTTWVARRNGKSFITGNSPIQGAASDYTLFSSILIWEKCRFGELPFMPQVYTVHDSLGYLVKPEIVHSIIPKLEAICANPETMEWFGFQIDDVTMKVDFEISAINWAELKNYNKNTDYSKLVNNNLIR